MNLSPQQLGRLTLNELYDLLEGWRWRDKWDLRRVAQLASWVTAPHLKKPVSVEDLIEDPSERKKTTPEESRAIITELTAEMVKGGENIEWQQ